GVGAEGDGDLVAGPGLAGGAGAHPGAVGAAAVLAQLLAEADLEHLREGVEGVEVLALEVERAGEDDLGGGLGLPPPPHDAPHDAGGRADAEVAPLLLAAEAGERAEVALDEGPERLEVQAADEVEGEVARVGEAVAVDLEGARQVERVER